MGQPQAIAAIAYLTAERVVQREVEVGFRGLEALLSRLALRFAYASPHAVRRPPVAGARRQRH